MTGRENIIVRIFDRKKFKGKDHTIFSDFLEAIGVDYTDDFKITEEEANRSLTGNSQEILRIVNTVLPDDDKVRTLVRQAAQDCENYKDPQNNFVMFSEEEFNKFTEQDAYLIFVTNEIGLGGVSPDAVQRRFTDLQGWFNQYIASRADEVVLMVSGIPMKVK